MRAPLEGRRAALLLIVASVLLFFYAAVPIVAGLVAAPALASVSRPIQQRLARHFGPSVSALIIVALLWIGLVLPGAWLAAVVVRQAPDAFRDVHRHLESLRSVAAPSVINVDSLITRAGASVPGWMESALGPTLAAIGHGVVNISIALLGLFFLLATGDMGWTAIRRWLPFSREGADELRSVFANAARATLLGTLASAALQGTSIGVGLRLIGNNAAAFWGFVAAFATLVPVVGNALVWVPAVVVPLVQQDYRAALVMVVCGKVIPALLDRVVRSGISRRLGNMHPMVTLVGVLLGVRLFGVAGVIVGPALTQTGIAMCQLFEREYGLWWTSPDERQRVG